MGALFLSRWAYIATTGIVLLRFWALLFGPERGRGGPVADNINDSVTFILVTLLLGFLLYRFRNQVQQLVFRANRSNTLLEASAAVGQIIARELLLDKLLNQAVDTIRDRFAFYHVQVFLIDEARDYAKLVASTGEAGARLLAREHKLLIGSQSVIGRVTQIGEPVIAHDTDVAGIHYRNELLPNTRSELALPIMDGDTIIGALDVQSARTNAFTDIDVQALQVVANLLATAIRNARLFEAQQRNLNENKRLFLEAEVNLREIQRLNRQLTGAAWTEFLRSREETSGITLEDVEIRKESNWTKEMLDAVKRRRPVTTERQGKQIVAVPIMLRGEVLGSIEVEVDPTQDESESVEMIQAIAERLAVSIDNARLFEEIQETGAAQQQINEIVGRYQTAGTVDDLLHITLEELSETLGAQRSAIRLSARTNQDNGDSSQDTA
ncbi:MAG: GAF domain-containing protein, partial [Chloroflexi bacterium]